MAKNTNPTGVYAPLNYRARRLIRQLRAATHRTVQNAIIQELIHEMQRGSRRVRKQSAFFGAHAKRLARQAGSKAGTAVRKRAGAAVQKARAPRMRCNCGQTFRSNLLFKAHGRAHQGQQPARGKAKTARQANPAHHAKAHARNVMEAAGPQRSAAARKATAQATTTGRALNAKDLKGLAKQARTAPPRRARTADPLLKARATRQTPATKAVSRSAAINRRTQRQAGLAPSLTPVPRAPRAAPALKLAPTPRAPRISRPAATLPVRPGRG